jgi:hypothetical protein
VDFYTGGPLLIWVVLYPEREAKVAYDHWILMHPTSSLELMPARLRHLGRCSSHDLLPAHTGKGPVRGKA